MTRQLNIRSDEAYRLAHDIADHLGKPVGEAVLTVLRDYGSRLPRVGDMTPAQRAEYEALMALAKKAAKHKKPGATSDHGDMYDEKGLPI